eukprot:scaffold226352_cov21-Tisochrysis_lutea.AAC.2
MPFCIRGRSTSHSESAGSCHAVQHQAAGIASGQKSSGRVWSLFSKLAKLKARGVSVHFANLCVFGACAPVVPIPQAAMCTDDKAL